MTDAELKALVASIAASQKELVEQQKRTDQQLAKTDAQLAKTDAQLAKTDAQLDRVSRKLDRLGELVGNISNNQGDIAEEFFYRSFLKNPTLGAMRFDTVSRNLNGHRGGIQEEYDLVLINGDSLVVLEVKAKAHAKDLVTLAERKLPRFKQLFKDLGHYRQYGGLATLASHEALTAQAEDLGLFLITQQGDHQVVVREGWVLG